MEDSAATTKELRAKIEPIFASKNIPKELQEEVGLIVSSIKAAPYFEEYDAFKKYIMQVSGVQEKNFTQILRLLLTGAGDGPDIALIYNYLKNYIGEIIK